MASLLEGQTSSSPCTGYAYPSQLQWYHCYYGYWRCGSNLELKYLFWRTNGVVYACWNSQGSSRHCLKMWRRRSFDSSLGCVLLVCGHAVTLDSSGTLKKRWAFDHVCGVCCWGVHITPWTVVSAALSEKAVSLTIGMLRHRLTSTELFCSVEKFCCKLGFVGGILR